MSRYRDPDKQPDRERYAPQIVLVTLRCGHVVEYRNPRPEVGQSIHCRRCNDWSEVIGIPDVYRARCNQCAFSQSYGVDRDRVLAGASRHVNKTAHTVVIKYGENYHLTVAPDPGQGSLPFEVSLTERREISRSAQEALRNFRESLPNRYPENP